MGFLKNEKGMIYWGTYAWLIAIYASLLGVQFWTHYHRDGQGAYNQAYREKGIIHELLLHVMSDMDVQNMTHALNIEWTMGLQHWISHTSGRGPIYLRPDDIVISNRLLSSITRNRGLKGITIGTPGKRSLFERLVNGENFVLDDLPPQVTLPH